MPETLKVCQSCWKVFPAKRADARTCSARCRQRLRRGTVDERPLRLDPNTHAGRPETDAEIIEGHLQDREARARAEERGAALRALPAETRAALKDRSEAFRIVNAIRSWQTDLVELDLERLREQEAALAEAGEGDLAVLRERVELADEWLQEVRRRLG